MGARSSFVLLLVCVFASEAAAQVFKCQDAEGRVVFSSFPCSDSAERVVVDVGSGDAPSPPPQAVADERAPLAENEAGRDYGLAPRAEPGMEGQPLSPEQLEMYKQMAEFQQQQAYANERRLRELEQEAMTGQPSMTSQRSMSSQQTTSYSRRQAARQADSDARACDSAERALDSVRAQGRRGYSANQARAYKNRLRQAKDRAREACRRR